MTAFKNKQPLVLKNDYMDKIDLQAILNPLWLNKKIIFISTIICFAVGIAVATIKIPLYNSNVLLQIEEQNNGLMSFDKMVGGMSPFNKGASAANVQTALIKSRYILDPVVEKLQLNLSVQPAYFPLIGHWYANKHNQASNKPWWGLSRFAWGNEQLTLSKFDVPKAFENKRFTFIINKDNHYKLYDYNHHLVVSGKVGDEMKVVIPGMGQFIIHVANITANKNTYFYLTKYSINSIVERLSHQLTIEDVSQEMHLNNNTGLLKVSLTGSDPGYIMKVLDAIAEVAEKSNIEKKSKETLQSIVFIKQQLPLIKHNLDIAETKLNQYLSNHGLIDLRTESKLLMDQAIATKKSLMAIKLTESAVDNRYTKYHPYMILLAKKRAVLEHEMDILHRKISSLPARDQEIIGLMREARVKNQLYIALLNKLQALEIAKGSAISDVAILGQAIYPDSPLPSNTLAMLTFSALLGFILGSAIIYIEQLWNRKICDPTVIEEQFGLSNMGIIPYSDKQMHVIAKFTSKNAMIPLLAKNNPNDLAIEALRSFRTSSQFAMLDAKNNIVTITGVAPGVGKSFVSVNFAYLLADAGKKVLLIDGDIRKGHLNDYFNLNKGTGLSELISGQCHLADALLPGPIVGLDFIATGRYPNNPAELFSSSTFKDFLATVSQSYDMVIIDTAPILAVTDAAIIAQYAGSNFLVLASNAHTKEEIQLALKRFEANGVHIDGAVFNFSKQHKGIQKNVQSYTYQYEYK
jgi:tyrosine-protein kinase Etk/Wzc